MKVYHNSSFTANGFSNDSNLGHRPNPTITTAKLDSVIYVNEDESILVTSSSCKWRDGSESEWKPGREKVTNNKLFKSKNLDSIKAVLKENYYFQNNIDEVKFINFEKPTRKEIRKNKKAETQKKYTVQKPKKPGNAQYYLGLIFFTTVAGVYSWRKNKK